MNTCSQLAVKEEEEDEGKTTSSDILHLINSWKWSPLKPSSNDLTEANERQKALFLWHPLIMSQHLVLPALCWSQTHFISWDNSGSCAQECRQALPALWWAMCLLQGEKEFVFSYVLDKFLITLSQQKSTNTVEQKQEFTQIFQFMIYIMGEGLWNLVVCRKKAKQM